MKEHSDELHLLAKALIEHETLSEAEVRMVIRGEQLPRDERGLKIDIDATGGGTSGGQHSGSGKDDKDKEPKKGPKVPGLQGVA